MNLTLKQYKTFDLAVFAILVCVFEAINVFAITQWFTDELFTISLLIPLSAIVFMRWGVWGILHTALSGLAFCLSLSLTQEVSFSQYVIYIVGNCFAALSLLMFLKVKKDVVAKKNWLAILYVAVIFLSVEVGRTLVSLCFNGNLETIVQFLAADSLSAAIGVVVVLIAKRQNGLFEDQLSYLRRLEQEKAEQRKLKDDGMQ